MKKMGLRPIYKKIDRSTLTWGITFPSQLYEQFQAQTPMKPGTSQDIVISWGRNKYKAKLRYTAKTMTKQKYMQIIYSGNPDLLKRLRKTFIQSYVILKSQKELFDSKESGQQFRSKLEGGQQEVLIVEPIDAKTIKFRVFIRIENEWNTLFQRLADENVFGWIFDRDRKAIITKSTDWIKVKDFSKHIYVNNVIYYLAHTKKKLFYIGKAETFGKRVRPGRKHQRMPADWDLFRYDVVKPEYSDILETLEDHTIRSFASILKNDSGYSTLHFSSYRLANSKWEKP